ncbi:hypothetical protein FQZ97_903340 [compost metagenome]
MSANVGEASVVNIAILTGRVPPALFFWNHSMKPVSSCTKVGRVAITHWLGRQPKPLAAEPRTMGTLSVGRRCCSAEVSGPPSERPITGLVASTPGQRLAVCAVS